MTAWKSLAARFAGEIGDLPLRQEALDYLKGIPSSQTVLVGCSGGADSIFLVLALLARLEDAGNRLQIVHFNHSLRGDASEEDEAFVSAFAREIGLPFHSSRAESPVPVDEHSLRALRYAWMSEVYKKVGAGALCLGHHADDLIESQLMALFSGSGPAGLAAPLPVKHFSGKQVRLRPLLALRRRQIEKLLRTVEAPWREDESNSDTAYTRNWIRHQLVPSLRTGFPQDIYAASAHTQTRMKESVEALDYVLDTFSLNFDDPLRIDLGPLAEQPRALVRRAIMSWWIRHHSERRLDTAILEGLLHAFCDGCQKASYSIGDHLVLAINSNWQLHLRPEQPELPRDWSGGANWSWSAGPLFLPDGSWLSAERVDWQNSPVPAYQQADPANEAYIAEWPSCIHVRQWEPGDRYQPLGAPGRRKLQDLFTDAKLRPEQKRTLPVLLNRQNEILWIPGFPPSEEARIQPHGNSALKLTYHRQ
ncbi:tRNA lysidine(34) synthetase TilS [Puniceicoccales bacterium CK1056]|uniref:tRNA(Ile)-lysidine synthase n=1 Tax=Oceanipulchritudo coccoides TaxID=2706888 RepID=A0A6B2LZ93_9BACT|nr:tRNA lysidine(34) synthetase TilS [Oceanipulchritudo coccoides]NDV61369.1 tRNA lysidine(34) synthetase TilS [Oceanipulchritudo coccoides]